MRVVPLFTIVNLGIYVPSAPAPRNAALVKSLHAPRYLLRRDVKYIQRIGW
jgi:hypothetical protein